MLLECGRLPEAALFARAYVPSKMSDCVKVRGPRGVNCLRGQRGQRCSRARAYMPSN